MPVYQYKCSRCGNITEARQKVKDAPLTRCGDCGGTLRRIISTVGVIFKGAGFYATDNKPSVGKPIPAKDSETREKKESTSETRAPEGKAEASSPTKATDSAA
ncbi:MAG: hypothetical protein HYU64_16900 [Armatimonadetes bacterium]|nr:hypothetical protein [Armatimonadota bacterium]